MRFDPSIVTVKQSSIVGQIVSCPFVLSFSRRERPLGRERSEFINLSRAQRGSREDRKRTAIFTLVINLSIGLVSAVA